MAFIELERTKFYYELHGSGQPIIFISGFSGDYTLWLQQVEALSKQFQILIFDNRGAGQTTDENYPLSAELMADDVMNLAKVLNLNMPHIVGSSMGGSIAQQIAIRHADRISNLVLMGTSAKWRQSALLSVANSIDLAKTTIPFALQFEIISSWLFGEAVLANPDSVGQIKSIFENNPFPPTIEGQERQLSVLQTFDSRELLSGIKAPTLVINGEEDLLSLPQESRYLAKHITQAQAETLPCGHMIMLEQAVAVNSLLQEFLN